MLRHSCRVLCALGSPRRCWLFSADLRVRALNYILHLCLEADSSLQKSCQKLCRHPPCSAVHVSTNRVPPLLRQPTSRKARGWRLAHLTSQCPRSPLRRWILQQPERRTRSPETAIVVVRRPVVFRARLLFSDGGCAQCTCKSRIQRVWVSIGPSCELGAGRGST